MRWLDLENLVTGLNARGATVEAAQILMWAGNHMQEVEAEEAAEPEVIGKSKEKEEGEEEAAS